MLITLHFFLQCVSFLGEDGLDHPDLIQLINVKAVQEWILWPRLDLAVNKVYKLSALMTYIYCLSCYSCTIDVLNELCMMLQEFIMFAFKHPLAYEWCKMPASLESKTGQCVGVYAITDSP